VALRVSGIRSDSLGAVFWGESQLQLDIYVLLLPTAAFHSFFVPVPSLSRSYLCAPLQFRAADSQEGDRSAEGEGRIRLDLCHG
jgi:hypothetical protein